MSFTLVEPFAGTAALSMHLLGATRQVTPYQGSKWKCRRQLADLLVRLGYPAVPSRYLWLDTGPWANTLYHLVYSAQELASCIEAYSGSIPELYKSLQVQPYDESVESAAAHLWLQRLAFSGKAVTLRGGRLVSAGLNKTSAYGVAGTERFGEVKPLIPSLVRVLRGLNLRSCDVCALQVDAFSYAYDVRGPAVFYLDPPYAGTTGYGPSVTRERVVALALELRELGPVLVSEAEPIEPLMRRGWSTYEILPTSARGNAQQPFRSKRSEWVTYKA